MRLEDSAEEALSAFREKISSMIIIDLQAVGGITPHQPTIYHYTDVRGALGILESGELWFTERAHLNDPVEIQYGLSIAHELFQTAVQSRGAAIPKEAASHLTGEHAFGLATYGFWIFSASLHDDDLGQWRNYADDGRGVCLGFSLENFNMLELAKLIPHNPNSLRFPINYDKDRLRQSMQRYIEVGLDLLEKIDLAGRDSYYKPYGDALLYERDFFYILNDGIFAHSLLSKHKAYAHEQEYRLLISGIRNTISGCGRHYLRERKGEIVGYLKLPIPAWKQPGVLTHIRIGPAAPNQLLDQIRMTLTTLGIPLPNSDKMDKSGIPYRSTR